MAIYYVYSGAGGSNNGSSWANAFTTLTTAFVTEVAGDTLYVAHDHTESTAGAVTLTSSGTTTNPTKVVCVNRAGTVPPVSADRRATAQVATTAANGITTAGCTHWDGIIFNCGTGATGVSLILSNSNASWQRFDNCSLRLTTTAALGFITVASGTTQSPYVELNNTTVSFGHVSNIFQVTGFLKWRNTPSALIGSVPTVFFQLSATRGGLVECIGVDLSAMGSGKTICDATSAQGAAYRFVDCKLNAAVTKTAAPLSIGGPDVDFVRSSATGNYAVHRQRVSGVLTEETTIIRTGGSSDGTTGISWKVVTAATCNYSMPFECPPIAIWNDTTGSAKTATIEGIWGGGAVPNDDDVWVDVEYLGDASSPQGSFVNDGKADLLTTAAGQTSSSATWGGSTTKFKLEVTFTAQMKGWVYARVRCAKASSTFYIDPLVTLT